MNTHKQITIAMEKVYLTNCIELDAVTSYKFEKILEQEKNIFYSFENECIYCDKGVYLTEYDKGKDIDVTKLKPCEDIVRFRNKYLPNERIKLKLIGVEFINHDHDDGYDSYS